MSTPLPLRAVALCVALGGLMHADHPRIGVALNPGTDAFGVGVRGWTGSPVGWHAALNTSWIPGDYWGIAAEGRLQVMTDGPLRWFVFGGFGGYRCSMLHGFPSDSFMLSLNGGIGVERLLTPDGRRSFGLAVGVQGGSAKYRMPERVFNPGAGEEYLTRRERDFAMPVVLLRAVYCWYASALSVTPRVERRDFVWGTVTDGMARPIPGSTVTLAGGTAIVNARGLYRIAGVEPGCTG